MKNPLVSVVIPTFNRAYLVGETLDTLLKQTYLNWECIIVDDGSTDDMDLVLKNYEERDQRFKYFKRPEESPKGGNTCRNYGIKKAKGDFIILFDSDDLMTPNHIELKISTILKYNCDFVITKTNFFNFDFGNIRLEKKYNFNSEQITSFDYISQKINWLTYDVCIKANIAKSIYFNEKLKSGQEYNYFSKLVLKTTNAIFVKEVVTLRRHHKESIRGSLGSNALVNSQSQFNAYFLTYNDIKGVANKKTKLFLINKCYKLAYIDPRVYEGYKGVFFKSIISEYRFRGVYYVFKLIRNELKVIMSK